MPSSRHVSAEASVVASLSELRAIEHQRLAEERAAERRAAEDAAARAAAAMARADREAAERRAAADAHARAIEDAAAAEQRARELAIAQTEIAARVRAEAELAATKLQEEMMLRREVASRQRPIALLAICGALVAGIVVVAFVARSEMAEGDAHARAAADAHASVLRAHELADSARDRTRALETQIASFRAQIDQMNAVVANLSAHGAGTTTTTTPHVRPRVGGSGGASSTPSTTPTPPHNGPITIDARCTSSALGCLPSSH